MFCIFTYTNTPIHTHVHTRTHTHTYKYMHPQIHAQTKTCTQIHTYKYRYTHTPTHKWPSIIYCCIFAFFSFIYQLEYVKMSWSYKILDITGSASDEQAYERMLVSQCSSTTDCIAHQEDSCQLGCSWWPQVLRCNATEEKIIRPCD